MSDIDRIKLDLQLEWCIDDYEEAVREFWSQKLDAEDWSEVNDLRRDSHQIAKTLRRRALAARSIGQVSELNAIYRVYEQERRAAETRRQEIADRFRDKLKGEEARLFREMLNQMFADPSDPEDETERPLHLVWQYLCIEDARENVDDIRGRVRRIFQLEELIVGQGHQAAIPQATKQFLALVARTFVWGFEPECVIVCRSVIDTAFRDAVPDELVETRRARNRDHDYTLHDRIEAAYPTLISEEIYKAATRIRERGRKAVHYDPTATEAILDTVKDTLAVVDHLAKQADQRA